MSIKNLILLDKYEKAGFISIYKKELSGNARSALVGKKLVLLVKVFQVIF